jgi:hypothetical protein
MTGFIPFTGFMPEDGDDPRVPLARTNPVSTGGDDPKRPLADGRGERMIPRSPHFVADAAPFHAGDNASV